MPGLGQVGLKTSLPLGINLLKECVNGFKSFPDSWTKKVPSENLKNSCWRQKGERFFFFYFYFLKDFYFLYFIIFKSLFILREREGASRRGAQKERIPSRLLAVSAEPHTGLKLTVTS